MNSQYQNPIIHADGSQILKWAVHTPVVTQTPYCSQKIENTEYIAVNVVLIENNKNNNYMLQSDYTTQNCSISNIGLQYIQG